MSSRRHHTEGDTVSRYPRFEDDAVLVVDAHNGPERWTGAQWNDYVERVQRTQSIVTVRLIECLPHPCGLPGGADPVDDHYATAAAILRPDSLPDPGWCGCADHTSPCPLIPPTEES